MKKITRNILAGIGIVSIGFMAYTLWDNYIENEIRQKKKSDAGKTAEFIAHRKAYAKAKRDSRAAENMAEQTVPVLSEGQDSMGNAPESAETAQVADTL